MKRERSQKRQQKIMRVLQQRQPDLTVVLDQVDDPHNVMAACRTCESVGMMHIHSVQKEFTIWNKKIGKRSAAGTLKWLELHRHLDISECLQGLKNKGYKIIVTHLDHEAKSIYETNFCQKVALVFGNEQKGVSQAALDLADEFMKIPQVGMTESLNVSVACALTAYEAFRQRTAAGKYLEAQLSAETVNAMYNNWLEK